MRRKREPPVIKMPFRVPVPSARAEVMEETRRRLRHRELGLWVAVTALPVLILTIVTDVIVGQHPTRFASAIRIAIYWACGAGWGLAGLWWLIGVGADWLRPRELRNDAKSWRATAAQTGQAPWPGAVPEQYRVGVVRWALLLAAALATVGMSYFVVVGSVIWAGLAGTPMHVQVGRYVGGKNGHYEGYVDAPPKYAGRFVAVQQHKDGTYYAWPASNSELWPRAFSGRLAEFAALGAAFSWFTLMAGGSVVERRRGLRDWRPSPPVREKGTGTLW